MAIPKPFLDALASSHRGPAIAEADDIFGFLIGSWEIDAVLHNARPLQIVEVARRSSGVTCR
jgi:hypothetical protein